ncbi:MAG: serine/threonine-protein kinase [Verrucomicrobiaceae bacterium]
MRSAAGRNTSTPGIWQAPAAEELQAMLPQYEVIGIIGCGGMGAVYKARQKSLRRLVAIKVLPPGVSDDELKFRERFQHEAETMAKLSSPGIVPVHDFGETAGGLLYFVMEFIDGTDVARRIASEGALPVEDAVRIIGVVCDALAYAHRQGVIHRDIKPANVLVDGEGRIKVADFGLAKIAGHSMQSGITCTNLAIGTQESAAPEQLMPGAVVDHRADIYSLGVMLYQMLTGEVPRVMFKLPSRCRPALGTRFDALICKALETDPADRFQSVEEFRRELNVAGDSKEKGCEPAKSGKRMGARRISAVVAGTFMVIAIAAVTHRSIQATNAARTDTTRAAAAARSGPAWQGDGWLKVLDNRESVVKSDIAALEWKDGWLVFEDSFDLFEAATKDKSSMRNAAVRAVIRPSINEHQATFQMRAGPKGQYNLDIYKDRLSLRRLTIDPKTSAHHYFVLKQAPLSLKSADSSFRLECSIQDARIKVSADGQRVMDVTDTAISEAGRFMLGAAKGGKRSAMARDIAIKRLPDAAVAERTDASKAGTVIELLPLIEVERDAVKGDWLRRVDGLAVRQSELGVSSLIQLPYKPPAEFDFEIEFTPEEGTGFVGQMFPAQGHPVTWLVDLPMSSGRKAGFFASVEGRQLKDNLDASIVRPRFLTNGKRHAARVEVREGAVTGWLDGSKLVEWSSGIGDSAHVSHDSGDEALNPERLALRAPQRAVVFHRITVREVNGTGVIEASALPARQ